MWPGARHPRTTSGWPGDGRCLLLPVGSLSLTCSHPEGGENPGPQALASMKANCSCLPPAVPSALSEPTPIQTEERASSFGGVESDSGHQSLGIFEPSGPTLDPNTTSSWQVTIDTEIP